MAQKIKRRTIVLNTTDKAQLFAEINKRLGRNKGRSTTLPTHFPFKSRSIAGIERNMDGSEFGIVRFWR